ncbi:TPA: hypothetical protein ACJHI9_003535 [Yersinia enterocolitica]
MSVPKDKKPGWVGRKGLSNERPEGVFDLNNDVFSVRRRTAKIDSKKKTGETISFDTADKLAEEIAALRTKNNG